MQGVRRYWPRVRVKARMDSLERFWLARWAERRHHHRHPPVRMRIRLVDPLHNIVFERLHMGNPVSLPAGPVQVAVEFLDANGIQAADPPFTTPLAYSSSDATILPSLTVAADGFSAMGTTIKAGTVTISATGTDGTGQAWSDSAVLTVQAGQAVTMKLVVAA